MLVGSLHKGIFLLDCQAFIGGRLNENAVNVGAVFLKCLAVNAVAGNYCKTALVFTDIQLIGVL